MIGYVTLGTNDLLRAVGFYDAMQAKALSLGAADEGAPGPRGIPGFYAAYFRDLDGNKLNYFCWTQC